MHAGIGVGAAVVVILIVLCVLWKCHKKSYKYDDDYYYDDSYDDEEEEEYDRYNQNQVHTGRLPQYGAGSLSAYARSTSTSTRKTSSGSESNAHKQLGISRGDSFSGAGGVGLNNLGHLSSLRDIPDDGSETPAAQNEEKETPAAQNEENPNSTVK